MSVLNLHYNKPPCLIIHAGAGNFSETNIPPDTKEKIISELTKAYEIGYQILNNGGSSIDAVEASIRSLEDSGIFNAGKGSCLTENKVCELDASIMDGSKLKGGAVAGVSIAKNPISLALQVLKSPEVMLIGKGAEELAKTSDLPLVSEDYYKDDGLKLRQWSKAHQEKNQKKYGTVGAVAIDLNGHLASGTSTGGSLYKKSGRVGDSPLIGAGTYANSFCAVSCTGKGESFINNAVASQIAIKQKHKLKKGKTLADIVDKILRPIHSESIEGGVIAINSSGQAAICFTTTLMYRCYRNEEGMVTVKISP